MDNQIEQFFWFAARLGKNPKDDKQLKKVLKIWQTVKQSKEKPNEEKKK